ncbi:MAG TPA: ChbG/HpnK family deacetylase [Planctomycetaceae bacterium]|nr:ChbG/HpnK family deacetylase [Planctomycetaceae bacterium]
MKLRWVMASWVVGLWALCTVWLRAGEPPEQSRWLILHADDAGMCHSANMGTIKAMEDGIVSSASIMVPCPWFVEFAEYARAHPEGDYGIHLTLNCEWKRYRWGPVAPQDKVPSLVDEQGYLWKSVRQVAKHARVEEVGIELRAQIDRARQFGIPLSHLDTHMGALVSRPDLLELYVRLGIQYDLPVLIIRRATGPAAREYPVLAERGAALVKLLEQHGLPVLDNLVQFYGGEGYVERRKTYLQALAGLPPGVSQLIVHCGYDNQELRAITESAARRDADRRIFTDPKVAAEIERMGITIINWKKFRQLASLRAAQRRAAGPRPLRDEWVAAGSLGSANQGTQRTPGSRPSARIPVAW